VHVGVERQQAHLSRMNSWTQGQGVEVIHGQKNWY
jgi:hypothetical protein